jgi:DNA repair protein SbcC/Rad50
MIPLQLKLKNFLSYREASLNFRGLHTACVCGANGAGKSSLLEAITWVIWGKSRAATEDDIIHGGANNVRVDFEFICDRQVYKVIRSRPRGRSSALEFQVATESGKFRSITGKGLRGTQEEIITCLKLDYDTFINSAYLRQGRADEFMLRRPSERKQILADLLKLDRYEILASKAKDLAKEHQVKLEQLKQTLQPVEERLAVKKTIDSELVYLATELEQLQQLQDRDRARLQELQAIEYQRQNWEQQFTLQQNQHQNLVGDCDRLNKDLDSLRVQEKELSMILAREAEILREYDLLLNLQDREKDFAAKFALDREIQQQKQQLKQQLEREKNNINLEIGQTQTRLESIEQQAKENYTIIDREAEITKAVAKLNNYRQQLQELDKIQQYVSPLLQQKRQLQTEIDKTQAGLSATLERLQTSLVQLETSISQVPQMRQRVLTVDSQIDELDKKRVRQKYVEEKGLERRTLRERLQENHRIYEQQCQELQQKLTMLSVPEATCPLCERELDEEHRHHVINKTQHQQEDIEGNIWIIRDRLATCEKELQVLRQEYKEISQELSGYDDLRQQLGQLEAQLEASEDTYDRLAKIQAEKEEIEYSLNNGNYADGLRLDLQQLEIELKRLNYDEQTHGLVRGEVERWRWAEIKQAKIEDAKKRQAKLDTQKPELVDRISQLQTALADLPVSSQIQQQIAAVERKIQEIAYDRTTHQNLLTALRQAQTGHLHYQELLEAQRKFPLLQTKIDELKLLLQQRQQDKVNSQTRLDNLIQEKNQIEDYRQEIQILDREIYQRRQQLDNRLSRRGGLQQSLVEIEHLQTQYGETQQQIQESEKKYRIYRELTQAFGKNGIQALTIENILPQLEAETNQILARLTGNQFHVQFLTQRASKNTSKKNTKLIDTLDILIADSGGTRPYETYSGGEAFRINFSVRLALAKLLAQRAGTSLQMLIVDEGFGTQDAEGCDRLVAAINAIASDFTCILTVTHMPQFKEAFQTRIEVYKSDRGSQLRLSS